MNPPPADDLPLRAEHGNDSRSDRSLPHLDHFGRHAGQTKHPARRPAHARHLQVDARRRAVRIEHHAAAGGNMRLTLVLRRHRPVPHGKHPADVLHALGIDLQRPLGGRRQGVARQIVGRRPQPAGGHHQVGPLDCLAENLGTCRQLVADGRMEEHGDAQFLEPLAEPLGVRVQRLPAGDLVTDGKDFGVHGTSVTLGVAQDVRAGTRPVRRKILRSLPLEWRNGLRNKKRNAPAPRIRHVFLNALGGGDNQGHAGPPIRDVGPGRRSAPGRGRDRTLDQVNQFPARIAPAPGPFAPAAADAATAARRSDLLGQGAAFLRDQSSRAGRPGAPWLFRLFGRGLLGVFCCRPGRLRVACGASWPPPPAESASCARSSLRVDLAKAVSRCKSL